MNTEAQRRRELLGANLTPEQAQQELPQALGMAVGLWLSAFQCPRAFRCKRQWEFQLRSAGETLEIRRIGTCRHCGGQVAAYRDPDGRHYCEFGAVIQPWGTP